MTIKDRLKAIQIQAPDGTYHQLTDNDIKQILMVVEVSHGFDILADNLVEKKYQLRIEHNHYDMQWYAYYAGRDERRLFDDDIDRETASKTPTEALRKLAELPELGEQS